LKVKEEREQRIFKKIKNNIKQTCEESSQELEQQEKAILRIKDEIEEFEKLMLNFVSDIDFEVLE